MSEDDKRPIFWKYDSILGKALFCPHCKTFICSGLGNCEHCGGEVDWKKRENHKGKVFWDYQRKNGKKEV